MTIEYPQSVSGYEKQPKVEYHINIEKIRPGLLDCFPLSKEEVSLTSQVLRPETGAKQTTLVNTLEHPGN